MPLPSTNIENDPNEALQGSAASGGVRSKGALGAMVNTAAPTAGGGGGQGAMSGLLQKQIGQLEKSRSEKKMVIDEAIKNLSSRETGSGPSAEELFRLMGAFAAPTKTGGFAETLGNVGNVGADILGKRKAAATSLEDLKTKYKLQGIDVDSEHLKEMIEAQKALNAEGAPTSTFGKIAKDEGLQPGTPAFNARVTELAAQDYEVKAAKGKGSVPELGSFDRKTGNYIAPNGSVIRANEVKEDRQERDSMIKLQDTLKKITPDVIKKSEGWDWTGSDTTKFIAGKFMPKQLAAQTTINAASLQERLKNLPPGPASDKDIAQARSSFPGFADAKALQSWIDLTNSAINGYIKRQDLKYGDAQWYGASGTAPGRPSDEKAASTEGAAAASAPATPSKQANAAAAPAAGTPKVGAVFKGHRFKGGDPGDKANWEKV